MRTDAQLVVLAGAGLSAASGVPTFRDADGLWERHSIEDVATPGAWAANPERVRTFYDQRRVACANVSPNAGHEALARLQQALGPDRVVLVTQNIDGLQQRAGAPNVIEMHGSLFRLRCEYNPRHPTVAVHGVQTRTQTCRRCAGQLRPAVVWFGEVPNHMQRIQQATLDCTHFVSVGTSGVVYPAAGLSELARAAGAVTIEVNPVPAGGVFDYVIDQNSEVALPRLVDSWLRDGLV